MMIKSHHVMMIFLVFDLDVLFSSPGTNVLGELMPYPRRRRRRRCRRRRQFQVKVSVY